jgi:hypothetical protein
MTFDPSTIFNLAMQLLPSKGSTGFFWQPTAIMTSRMVARHLTCATPPNDQAQAQPQSAGVAWNGDAQIS